MGEGPKVKPSFARQAYAGTIGERRVLEDHQPRLRRSKAARSGPPARGRSGAATPGTPPSAGDRRAGPRRRWRAADGRSCSRSPAPRPRRPPAGRPGRTPADRRPRPGERHLGAGARPEQAGKLAGRRGSGRSRSPIAACSSALSPSAGSARARRHAAPRDAAAAGPAGSAGGGGSGGRAGSARRPWR